MLTKTPHLFDDATKVTPGDSRWQGHTSDDYWAFVGPFGGCTAATILRAVMEHPDRAGDPTAMTVNYCAPIAQGPFDLDVRLVKANRSSQHWCVELSQGNDDVSTLATIVLAERRQANCAQMRHLRAQRLDKDVDHAAAGQAHFPGLLVADAGRQRHALSLKNNKPMNPNIPGLYNRFRFRPFRRRLGRTAAEEGWSVRIAETGRAALDMIEQAHAFGIEDVRAQEVLARQERLAPHAPKTAGHQLAMLRCVVHGSPARIICFLNEIGILIVKPIHSP